MHPSVVVTRLATIGAPPSTLIGVRNALQRRGPGTNVPIGTAYLGTVLAVVVLCATAVFGASLSHLTATPSLYGDAYQLSFDVIPGLPDPGLLKSIEQNGHVSGITRVVATQVSIDHTTLARWRWKRSVVLCSSRRPGKVAQRRGSDWSGRGDNASSGCPRGLACACRRDDAIGGKRTVPFRVVANIPIPVMDGFAGLGNGEVIPLSGYEAAVCPSAVDQVTCRKSVEGSSIGSILAKGVSGPRGQSAIAHFSILTNL